MNERRMWRFRIGLVLAAVLVVPIVMAGSALADTPTVSITSGPNNPTNSTDATFIFSSSDETATFQCDLDGGGYSFCASPTGYTGLSEGDHSFSVQAVNADGPGTPATYTWTVDNGAPSVSLTAPSAGAYLHQTATLTATASDNSGGSGVASVAFESSPHSTGTWTTIATDTSSPYSASWNTTAVTDGSYDLHAVATDNAGNSYTSTTVTVTVDNTAPIVSIGTNPGDKPDNPTNQTSASIAFSSTDGTATFKCKLDSGTVSGTYSSCTNPWTQSGLTEGSYTFYVEAADPAGNTGTPATYTWTIDTEKPVITKPTDMIVDPDDQNGANVDYTLPTATDNVDTSVTVVCAPPPGHFAIGTTTVTCNATDRAGNAADSVTFAITVKSWQGPTFHGTPSDITAEATGPDGAVVTYTPPTATGHSGNDLPVTCTPAPGSTFTIGAKQVECSVTENGIKYTTTFKVTVQDTTAPVISSTPVQIGVTSSDGVVVTYTMPTAYDAVDGPLPVSCSPASGSVFPVGTTTVTCSSSDSRGNTSSTSFNVVVSLPAPAGASTMITPPNLVVEATSKAGAVVNFDISSVDDPAPTIVCEPAPGSLFPFGMTTVTCTATNADGGKTVKTFTVTVHDTTAPVFSGKHAKVVKQIAKPGKSKVSFKLPKATDKVDGSVKVSCSPRPNSSFKPGKTKVTCKAKDSSGNSRTISFSVQVKVLPKGPLLAPLDGAVLRSPPVLAWAAVKNARYYNVQLWRKNSKLLSVWPRKSRLQLKKTWSYAGASHRLKPGVYIWYVWPGFGKLSAAKYGKLIGKGTFSIR
jgi:hypothetical protein